MQSEAKEERPIWQMEFYQAAPEWLKTALMQEDWVKQQSEAWERWSTKLCLQHL